MNKIFFVLGNPRSGTTLLRLMLNNHPSITIPPECGFMLWLAEKYALVDFSREDNIEAFLDELVKTKKFETWNLDEAKLRAFLTQGKPISYQDASLLVYRFYAHSVGKDPLYLGDKNNFYIDYLPQIRKLFPGAKLILIVRDGRDVACSYRDLAARNINSTYAPRLPLDIDKIAHEWSANNSVLIRELSNDGVAMIRYEDLIARPMEELEKLCNFLGLQFNPMMLEYHTRNAVEQQEPEEFLKWKEKTLEPPDVGNAGKYKRLLTPSEIEEFNRIGGEVLARFGYETERKREVQ